MAKWTGEALDRWMTEAPRLWLFLDYDGTLAEFSQTPDLVELEAEAVELVRGLAASPRIRVAVISGRTLKIVQSLLPVEGIYMAGVYGVEMRPPDGEVVHRENYGRIRPYLEGIKPGWQALIANKPNFFLEDKGWTLAIHADKAEPALARTILMQARESVLEGLPRGVFRWFLDDCFLEVAPQLAHKGKTVGYMYSHFPLPEARLLYIGDDDKDEEAFQTVHAFGGVNILVSRRSHPYHSSEVDYIIDSPATVRRWLQRLLPAPP